MTPFEIAGTGVIATATADLWQHVLNRFAGLPVANWQLIGRWVGWMPRGVFSHRPISAARPVPGEQAIGWAFHYGVGVAYAGLYPALLRATGAEGSGLTSALVFASATLAAPWLVMQPALGAGIFARNLPNRWPTRIVTATTHLAFGIGLYAGPRAIGA